MPSINFKQTRITQKMSKTNLQGNKKCIGESGKYVKPIDHVVV